MRTFEITYILYGKTFRDNFKASTNAAALRSLFSRVSRRDKLFFKFVSISMV